MRLLSSRLDSTESKGRQERMELLAPCTTPKQNTEYINDLETVQSAFHKKII